MMYRFMWFANRLFTDLIAYLTSTTENVLRNMSKNIATFCQVYLIWKCRMFFS